MSGQTPKRVCRARRGNTRRALVFALACGLGVTGCTEQILLRHEARLNVVAEPGALPELDQITNLQVAAELADYYAELYAEAAHDASQAQDFLASLTFVAAAATAYGGVVGASDTELAKRALMGASTTFAQQRLTPRKAIQAVIDGAKRHNCIAIVARIGAETEVGKAMPKAAAALTAGAIRLAVLTTRSGLLRDTVDFDTLLSDLSVELRGAENSNGAQKVVALELRQYQAMLATCFTDTAALPVVPDL